VDLKFYK